MARSPVSSLFKFADLIGNIFPNYSKDVRLPVQLQRAMAAEAEAAREARAKVRNSRVPKCFVKENL